MNQVVLTTVGAGTLVASTGASTVVPTVNATGNSGGGTIIVAVCLMAGDATLVTDLGDGWVINSGYNSGAGLGLFLACCYHGGATTGWQGFDLKSSVAHTLQCYTFRVNGPFRFDLANVAKSSLYFLATSNTTCGMPELAPSAQSGLFVGGIGYANGGTTTTISGFASTSEVFDTGQASPPHGVSANYANSQAGGTGMWGSALRLPQLTGANLAVAKANKFGLRMFIPFNQNVSRQHMTRRRIG